MKFAVAILVVLLVLPLVPFFWLCVWLGLIKPKSATNWTVGPMVLVALLGCNAFAATLRWDDNTNPAGTSYIISNKVGASWQFLTHTTNKSATVTLQPGTNTFSLVASNGLSSDPALSSTNYPAKVINIIIEAKQSLQDPWVSDTNFTQFVYIAKPATFIRARLEPEP